MKPYSSISVVIPVYNDEAVLPELFRRLLPILQDLTGDYEIVFVDDGSEDQSYRVLQDLYAKSPRIKILKQARNYGQANAIAAGLSYASCDYIVLMDSDLQDRPEDIPALLQAMMDNDVLMAVAQWQSRQDSWIKRQTSRCFYELSNRITNIQHEPNLGVFRVLKRKVVDLLEPIPESTGSMISLMYWSGLSYVPVPLHRDSRFAGDSGYDLRKMYSLAADRIFSHSVFPIKLASYVGFFLAAAGLLFIAGRWVLDLALSGWPIATATVLLLFGVQLIFIGLVGEYLGRIYLESKGRPRYVTETIIDADRGSVDYDKND